MIVGSDITKSYTDTSIIEGLDFKAGNRTKIGLVGKNGCGKSTLLKLIVGEFNPDSGNIQIESERLGYIPQEFSFPNEMVGEYLEKLLENSWDTYKLDILVNELQFHNYDPYQLISTLSEGQKMKVKLMETLILDPTTLLIDEPTNHLDIEGIIWFEKYIKQLPKTVVMISHDREFLNNTVDEIWEIENKKLLRFVGNFDAYREQKLKLIDKWNQEYVLFVKHKKKLEDLLKLKMGGTEVQAVRKRIDREITRQEKVKYVESKMKSVKFNTTIQSTKLMVRFNDVSKSYKRGKYIFKDLSFELRAGQKIWLFGPNGAGKTTMVKMIKGEESPTSGEVRIGNDIRIGYFAQKQTHLDYDKRLMEYFMQETGCYYEDVFGALKRFMFEKDDLKKFVRDLSPGQRARFAFAIFAYKDYDMLVLDEPTNHLDIETKESIEESLQQHRGTLLLISHDRFFVERVGINKMLNLTAGKLTEY